MDFLQSGGRGVPRNLETVLKKKSMRKMEMEQRGTRGERALALESAVAFEKLLPVCLSVCLSVRLFVKSASHRMSDCCAFQQLSGRVCE